MATWRTEKRKKERKKERKEDGKITLKWITLVVKKGHKINWFRIWYS
jgi:hypothetical protein